MSNKIPTQDQSPNPVQIHSPKLMHIDKAKIFPRSIRGFYQNIRHVFMAFILFVYVALAWVMGWPTSSFI